MKILIACEFSGIVRDAFINNGHDAISCDLLPTESPGPHYQGDVFDIINDGFDMMIAHPPCTYISNAGAVHLYPFRAINLQRYFNGLHAKKFFMGLFNSNINKIVIENPVPSKAFDIPEHSQVIQPYEYGHKMQKKTLLWIKNLPLLKPTNIIDNPQSTKIPGNWYNKGGKDRQKNRAKTFQGIATAMADQWGYKARSDLWDSTKKHITDLKQSNEQGE